MLLKKKNLKVYIIINDIVGIFHLYDNKKNFLGNFDSIKQYLKINDKEYIKLNSIILVERQSESIKMLFNAVLLEE